MTGLLNGNGVPSRAHAEHVQGTAIWLGLTPTPVELERMPALSFHAAIDALLDATVPYTYWAKVTAGRNGNTSTIHPVP